MSKLGGLRATGAARRRLCQLAELKHIVRGHADLAGEVVLSVSTPQPVKKRQGKVACATRPPYQRYGAYLNGEGFGWGARLIIKAGGVDDGNYRNHVATACHWVRAG